MKIFCRCSSQYPRRLRNHQPKRNFRIVWKCFVHQWASNVRYKLFCGRKPRYKLSMDFVQHILHCR